MSRRFGAVRQLGLVVRDPQAAMRYWTETLGIGPFFVTENAMFQDYRYKGQAMESPVMSFCYAQANDLQVEIIAQHCDTPSGYRDFLESGREGCQHLSSWFSTPDDFDEAYRKAIDSGARVIHEGSAGGPRFAYFDTYGASGHGLAFELAEGLLAPLLPVHEMMAAGARDWDGSDPVRPMPG